MNQIYIVNTLGRSDIRVVQMMRSLRVVYLNYETWFRVHTESKLENIIEKLSDRQRNRVFVLIKQKN